LNKKILGVFFILLSILIVFVSAFIYETATQTVTQTITNIATLVLSSPALGTIEEGETNSLTKANIAALGDAISITTTKANVYLHLDSDIDSLSTYYTTYSVTVKFATVPGGSVSHTSGDVAATITIASPDPAAIDLDAAGLWTFDFEITTTAQSVSANQDTTATIVVTAESTT
jgi:hypothetical protein